MYALISTFYQATSMKRTQSEDREVGNQVQFFSFLSQSSPPTFPQRYISFINSLLCQAQNGQRAISASTDYLNKKSKDFMVRRRRNVNL